MNYDKLLKVSPSRNSWKEWEAGEGGRETVVATKGGSRGGNYEGSGSSR